MFMRFVVLSSFVSLVFVLTVVVQEHSDGSLLLVMLTANRPSSNIDVLFFTNTAQYSDRSRTSITFLPASPLAPIERTLLESVIEFRNVVELDTWLPGSFEKLSLSEVSKSATGQSRRSIELDTKAPPPPTIPAVQKRKEATSAPENVADAPLLGKVKNYFNKKLPSFSSMFSFHAQQPTPAQYSRSTPNLHLLFSTQPSKSEDIDYLINYLPYELLVHIFKYIDLEDVRACSQLSHRAWQVTNTDVVWRDQIAHLEAQKRAIEGWEKYAPLPHFTSPDTPPRTRAMSDSPFEKPVWARATDSSPTSPVPSRNNSIDVDISSMQLDPSVTQELKHNELKSLLDSVQGYARYACYVYNTMKTYKQHP